MASDAEIIKRSLEEPDAFEAIFDRHFDAVLRYARRRIGHDAGEEVASQTFLVAFDIRQRFDPAIGSARPWLLGIASNLVRHHMRDEATHLAALGRMIPADAGDDPEDAYRLDARRLGPILVSLLRDLPAGDRDAFLLLALGEFRYEEIAAALEIPVGTVRSRIHRVRVLLRERLQGEWETSK